MRSQDLHQRLADLGAKPLHCGRIVRAWRWSPRWSWRGVGER